MKVMATGGAGYIGSVTASCLLDAGHEVVVFDNLELGHRCALDSRAELVEGDLRDLESIRTALRGTRPDAVVHFAAYTLVGESMQQPGRYFRNNVVGSVNLLEAMLESEVSAVVFSSSCATYGAPVKIPISETESQEPTNPYGQSKLQVEMMLRWYAEIHGLRAVCLRYFNAAGATDTLGEDHDPETHLIPLVLQVALGRRDRVTIHGDDYDTPDGTCIRDYIHIDDIAHAHLLGLESDFGGALNLGNGDGYSVREVVDIARSVTGREIPAETGPRRFGDPPRLIADASRASAVLGWKPRRAGLEEIVESAWRWHSNHPDGYKD